MTIRQKMIKHYSIFIHIYTLLLINLHETHYESKYVNKIDYTTSIWTKIIEILPVTWKANKIK